MVTFCSELILQNNIHSINIESIKEQLEQSENILKKLQKNKYIYENKKNEIEFDLKNIQDKTEKKVTSIKKRRKKNLSKNFYSNKHNNNINKINDSLFWKGSMLFGIKDFRKAESIFKSMYIFKEDEKHIRNREKLILEIISYVKALRINSINVINYFLKVREIINYYRLIGKVDMKLINSNFKYSDDYLKKMKREMDFLKQYKQMHKYFDMNNGEIDAFLTNFDSKPSNNIKYTE